MVLQQQDGPSTAGWGQRSEKLALPRIMGQQQHPRLVRTKAAPWKHNWLKQPGQFAIWKGGNSQGISTIWIWKETRGMLVMRRRRRSGGEWCWWDVTRFFLEVSSEDSSEDSPEDFPETKSSQENPQKNPQNRPSLKNSLKNPQKNPQKFLKNIAYFVVMFSILSNQLARIRSEDSSEDSSEFLTPPIHQRT